MKLIFCPRCADVVKLQEEPRKCKCGLSSGYYERDGLNAVVVGEAIPIIFDNPSFTIAIENQPESGLGRVFIAAVAPRFCPTISVADESCSGEGE